MHASFINRAILTLAFALSFTGLASAQSSSQEYPTAVLSNEISGTIKARDIGDSRLTTYYYTFNGEQGDLFINLVTRNFAGDIDVFTINGLRPLTKIVVHADYGDSETGRAIYFRKHEKLLLRVQGRTPNDDEATFRLKFAGSFAAARPDDVPAAPELPKVSAESRAGIRVNSAGTILAAPARSDEAVADKEPSRTEPAVSAPQDDPAEKPEAEKEAVRSEVVVSDPVRPTEKPETTRSEPPRSTRRRSARQNAGSPPAIAKADNPEKAAVIEDRVEPTKAGNEEVEAQPVKEEVKAESPKTENRRETKAPSFRTLTDNRRARTAEKEAEPKVDPLASVNFIVQFKNGESLEKKMSEVFKFTFDKGVLTVILKDGSVTRYPIVDVAKVTIE